MEQDIRAVERWAALPREDLVVAVTAAVRRPPADPSRFWHAVQSDPVLAATVRGVLSGLLRDKEGSRDEVFWTYRINTVRAALNSTETGPGSARQEPVPAAPGTSDPSSDEPSFATSWSSPVAGTGTVAESTRPSTVPSVSPIEFHAPGC
jgi:hypothetical protein